MKSYPLNISQYTSQEDFLNAKISTLKDLCDFFNCGTINKSILNSNMDWVERFIMAKIKRTEIKKIAAVYEKKGGNMAATAVALGITRQALYKWRKEEGELAKMLDDIDEGILDFTESKLIEKVNEGNLTAIIFLLKTKGKKRGYVEQVDNKLVENPFEKLMKELPDDEE